MMTKKEYVRGIYYNTREQGSFGTFTELYKRINANVPPVRAAEGSVGGDIANSVYI